MQTEHRVVLDEHVVDGGLRDAPRGEADDHDPPLEGDAFGRAVVHVAPDRVEHDVVPPTIGEPLDLFHEVVGLGVYGVVGAQAQTHLDLLVRTPGRDDPGPDPFAHLTAAPPPPPPPPTPAALLPPL